MKRFLLLLSLTACGARAAAAEEECTRDTFVAWLRDNGAKISPHLQQRDGGIFLHTAAAATAVKGEEVLVSIPRNLYLLPDMEAIALDIGEDRLAKLQASDLLSTTTSAQSNTNQEEEQENERFTWEDIMLTLQLMREFELGAKSYFYEYVQQLPSPNDVHGWLHVLPSKEVELLAHPAAVREVMNLQARIELIHDMLFLSENKSAKFDLFAWANAMERSRAFRNGKEVMFVPFLDAFRRTNAGNARTEVTEESAKLRLASSTAIKSGEDEEVLLPFPGRFSNLYLAMHFNQVITTTALNEFDVYPVNVPKLSEKDPLFSIKSKQIALDQAVPFILAKEPPKLLIAFFRLVMTTSASDLKTELFHGPAGGPVIEEIALTSCVRQMDNELAIFKDLSSGNALVRAFKQSQVALLLRARSYCEELRQITHDFPDEMEGETDEDYNARFEREIQVAMSAVHAKLYE